MRELRTPRLLLRPLAAADRAFYVAMYGDAEVMRHVGPALSEDQAAEAFRRSLGLCRHPRPLYWLWVLAPHGPDGDAGLIGLQTIASGAAEVGVLLLRPARSRGFAAEAIACVADHAFRELGFDRLRTRHRRDHAAARALMEKLAFAPIDEGADGTGDFRWELQRDR